MFIRKLWVFLALSLCAFNAVASMNMTSKQFVTNYNKGLLKLADGDSEALSDIKIINTKTGGKSVQYIISENASGFSMLDDSGKINYMAWFVSGDKNSDDVDTLMVATSAAMAIDVLDDSINFKQACQMVVNASKDMVNNGDTEYKVTSRDLKYTFSKSDVLPFSVEISSK